MPELPEVEIVRQGLSRILQVGVRVERLELKRWDLRAPIPRALPKKVAQQEIVSVQRRAKYLLIEMPNGFLLSHLGMTGSWRVLESGSARRPHDHAFLHLSSGQTLAYHDPRRFGLLDWFPRGSAHPRLSQLGPEPLDSEVFTALELQALLKKRKVAIKVALMNQQIVVGVGNIYASEALFRAGIRPSTPSERLSLAKLERLVHEVRAVLSEAIARGGSSIRDYVNAEGERGDFQSQFFVYDRKGEPCRVCGSAVRSFVLGGRSTFWCRSCQK